MQLGMEQQFELGCFLRQRYACTSRSLLSPVYNASQVMVRSTADAAAVQSALVNMAGFFPYGREGVTIPSRGSPWPNQWQPVPVYTSDRDRDQLMGTQACNLADGQITRLNSRIAEMNATDDDLVI